MEPVAALNIVTNGAIVLGYLLVPFLWLPYLPLTRPVLISGTAFFFTCAMTHLALAFGWQHSGWLLVNHFVQAVSVLFFVGGFSRLLRRANVLRHPSEGEP